MHPLIDNRINPATKMSEVFKLASIAAKQNKLNIKYLNQYKKAIHIIELSINHN